MKGRTLDGVSSDHGQACPDLLHESSTGDDLCTLLASIRRHVHDAPSGTWAPETVQAARTLSRAVSSRLASLDDGGPGR